MLDHCHSGCDYACAPAPRYLLPLEKTPVAREAVKLRELPRYGETLGGASGSDSFKPQQIKTFLNQTDITWSYKMVEFNKLDKLLSLSLFCDCPMLTSKSFKHLPDKFEGLTVSNMAPMTERRCK